MIRGGGQNWRVADEQLHKDRLICSAIDMLTYQIAASEQATLVQGSGDVQFMKLILHRIEGAEKGAVIPPSGYKYQAKSLISFYTKLVISTFRILSLFT